MYLVTIIIYTKESVFGTIQTIVIMIYCYPHNVLSMLYIIIYITLCVVHKYEFSIMNMHELHIYIHVHVLIVTCG